MPEDLRTEALRLVAVQQTGWALEFVPKAVLTEAICLAAVRENGLALELVPEDLQERVRQLLGAE